MTNLQNSYVDVMTLIAAQQGWQLEVNHDPVEAKILFAEHTDAFLSAVSTEIALRQISLPFDLSDTVSSSLAKQYYQIATSIHLLESVMDDQLVIEVGPILQQFGQLPTSKPE